MAGMGLNYFAYAVVLHMGFTWQAALGAVFIGCLFLVVTLFGIRRHIIDGTQSLRSAITVGTACSWH